MQKGNAIKRDVFAYSVEPSSSNDFFLQFEKIDRLFVEHWDASESGSLLVMEFLQLIEVVEDCS